MSPRLSTAIRICDAATAILRKTQSVPEIDLGGDGESWSEREHIGVEPMLLALSMELALKAWYAFDYDVSDPKKGHDLAKLFDALTPKSQQQLDEEFRRSVAPRHPSGFSVDYGIRDILYQHKDAFTKWRYMHEKKENMRFSTSAFEATLEMVLAEFRARYRTERVVPPQQT